MFNTTSEIKSLYNDLKGAIKSPESILFICICGIILKYIFPSKYTEFKGLFTDKLINQISTIVDGVFLVNALICSVLFILIILFMITYLVLDSISNKFNHNLYLTDKSHFYHRAYLGTNLRFLFVSRWLIILFCILILLDATKIKAYFYILTTNIFKQPLVIFILIFISLSLIKTIWHLVSSVFYKYLYLQPIENKREESK